MEGDLLLRGVAEVTRAEYLRCARQLAAHYHRSPAGLRADDLRRYLLHLAGPLHYSPATLKMHGAALKFLYTVTLNRPALVARIPYPKVPRVRLDIPSPGEVAKVLSALRSPKYRMLLLCAYGAGLRVTEACTLCIGDLDSSRVPAIPCTARRLRSRADCRCTGTRLPMCRSGRRSPASSKLTPRASDTRIVSGATRSGSLAISNAVARPPSVATSIAASSVRPRCPFITRA